MIDVLLATTSPLINTCTIYGGTNSWVGINLLILLVTLAITAIAYLVSRPFPTGLRTKVVAVAKSEILTALISAIMLMVILGMSSLACVTTATISTNLQSSAQSLLTLQLYHGFPAINQMLTNLGLSNIPSTSDPYAYASTYVGNIAFELGPAITTQMYSYSYEFGYEGGAFTQYFNLFSSMLPTAQLSKNFGNNELFGIQVLFPIAVDLSIPYTSISDIFVDIFSPIMMVSIGVQLMQYIILVVSHATAFVILLPVALALRSLAFLGGHLRQAANAVLALSIAMYLVYPMTIVFDSYVFNWIFTPCPSGVLPTANCNPSAQFLYSTYTFTPLDAFNPPTQSINIAGFSTSTFTNPGAYFTSLPIEFAKLLGANGPQLAGQIQSVMALLTEYVFLVLVMFAMNLSITMGFAMGLARSLNNGLDGGVPFWGSL